MTRKLRVLDLFSGIGGFSLGLERTGGFETVAFCEIDPFCRKVLAKHWPDVPCFEDVRELKGRDLEAIDVICGGYPCQPFSHAGKRLGKEDDRHLWPEIVRLMVELRPAWVIGENVAGHISMGLDDALSDLEREGYTARTFVIPACAVGAHHRRDRCWTIANTDNVLHSRALDNRGNQIPPSRSEGVNKSKGQASNGQWIWIEPDASSKNVANASLMQRNGSAKHPEPSERQVPQLGKRSGPQPLPDANGAGCKKQWWAKSSQPKHETPQRCCWWEPEPSVGRVAHGVPNRVDRLRALGNAVVPQIPEILGRAILEVEAA